ncbi:MAG TPA: tetratricopeptide repeat protein [Pirellulales bacterium]|nr:tetratricopeptide repeat protein [Pirellulales bacterium]
MARYPWRILLRTPLAGLVLVAMVLATFAPTLRNQYIWDDDSYVTKNLNLRTPEGLYATWFEPFSLPQYYPLVHTTFWLEYQAWKLNPLGYHVDNMLLHAVGVLLAWRVLLRLGVPWAWLAAALFAVHPVVVESVAWITERKNVLSEVLVLASMLCYLRFAPVDEATTSTPSGRWRWLYYGLALVLFAGALLSKTVVASMPAALLVIYWWRRGRIGWREILPLVPFLMAGAGLGMVTAWLERIHVGAEGDDWSFTRAERLLIAGRAVWFYATKLAWPHPIIFFYRRWDIDGHVWWQYLFPAAAMALVVVLWLARKRTGRGPLAAALIFGGVLVPAIGFFNVYPFRFSFVADHFQYHATLALFALAAAGCALLDARLTSLAGTRAQTTGRAAVSPHALQLAWRSILGVVLLVLSTISFRQCFTYYDLETLYNDVIKKNPTAWVAYSNLGAHFLRAHRGDEATDLLRRGLEVAPKSAYTHSNYGCVILDKGKRDGFEPGQLEEAIAHFEEAIQLEPRLLSARVSLAEALAEQHRIDEAEKNLSIVLDRQPNNVYALAGMGSLLVTEKRWEDARKCFQRAVDYSPRSASAQHGLGLALVNLGRNQEALSHLHIAAQLNPDSHEIHYVWGNALFNLGDYRTAIDQYDKALEIKEDYLDALSNRGVAFGQLGDADRAIQSFQRLVELDPDFNGAKENLKNAIELKKQQSAAVKPN